MTALQSRDHPERDPPVRQLQDSRTEQRADDRCDAGDALRPGSGTCTNRAPEARSTTRSGRSPSPSRRLKPCTSRATIITPIDGLNAHTTEASDSTTSAAEQRAGGVPAVRDRPADQLTQRHPDEERGQRELHLGRAALQVAPTRGNAGTYMSVASGAIVVISTTFASTDPAQRAAPRAATASRFARRYWPSCESSHVAQRGVVLAAVRHASMQPSVGGREEVSLVRCTSRASLRGLHGHGSPYRGRHGQPVRGA